MVDLYRMARCDEIEIINGAEWYVIYYTIKYFRKLNGKSLAEKVEYLKYQEFKFYILV